MFDTLRRPLNDLRLSVIDQCNMRCPYCMPAEVFGDSYRFLGRDELLSFDEIDRLVRVFVALGVDKVKITGGEPLLRPSLPELVHRLARIDGVRDLALITNGVLLEHMAKPLKRAGLCRVTVSLDSLRADTFSRLSGRGRRLELVLKGLHAAEQVGLTPIKINCVVMKGINEDDVLDLVDLAAKTGYIVRFIEYMDVGGSRDWQSKQVVPASELIERIQTRFSLEPLEATREGEVARRYGLGGGRGEIGFITSVTEPFCATCARARLSADGRLFTCLFATEGHDLRRSLREGIDDEGLLDAVRRVWQGRSDRYSEERADRLADVGELQKVKMHFVGG